MGRVTTEHYRSGKVIGPGALAASTLQLGASEFVWIDAVDPSDSELTVLQERFHLHGLAVGDSMSPVKMPKVDLYDDQVFVLLQNARLENDAIKYGEIAAFVGRNHVITVHRDDDPRYRQARERLRSGPASTRLSPDFALHAMVELAVGSYFPVVQMIEEEVLSMEQMFMDAFLGRAEVTRLFQLRGEALRLQQVLTQMSDVCGKLSNLQVPCIGSEVKPYFRDVHDHLARLDAMLHGLIDVIRGVFEASNLLEQQRQGSITRQLAAWAAILGVPTVFAAIYGMNLPNMPALQAPSVYLAVVGVMLLTCLALYVRFRRLRWL